MLWSSGKWYDGVIGPGAAQVASQVTRQAGRQVVVC